MITKQSPKIAPVILSGGAGSRLWPVSRQKAPKQLHSFVSANTLLQDTVLRVSEPTLFHAPTVIAAAQHGHLIDMQLKASGLSDTRIVLEPVPRNTAAAAAVAALLVARSQPDALMLLMPADHAINDVEAFRKTVQSAACVAREGYFTLFGIEPAYAATAYGYIRLGSVTGISADAFHVVEFVEKPDEPTAQVYAESGRYLWNSGIFLMPVQGLLAELRVLEPELLQAAEDALESARTEDGFLRLDADAFSRCRSTSIDYAVMERTKKAAVLRANFDWTDIGSWSGLWSISDQDESGNATVGDALTLTTRNSYVRSEGPTVVTIGAEDMIIIASADAVLVARKDKDQEIRQVVETLRARKPELL